MAEKYDEVGRGRRLADESTWSTDIPSEEDWSDDELRERIAPSKSTVRRRLGDTRGAFAARLEQRRRAIVDTGEDVSARPRPGGAKRRTIHRRSEQRQLEEASTTALVELLTRELRETAVFL